MFIFFQTNPQSYGQLRVEVSDETTGQPIEGADIDIFSFDKPDLLMYSLKSDQYGKSQTVDLPSPPISYSMKPSPNLPYSKYNVKVFAPGYKRLEIYGTQILPDNLSIQPAVMPHKDNVSDKKIIIIGPNELDTI